ncbi:MAG TPA: glycerol-3-phosphate 1-O-acyltransferase PlsY [Desulfurivibrionaceae bacterium]|nr:glycerol-3-phosphate 1-O-acyltransferase PlsY [Desulfurivibrionaceae bacterium]
MNYILICIGYLLGSVPFGLLYGKLAGVDVRRQGSGTIGATNVGRLLGKKLGALTLISDLLKGILPMLLAVGLLGDHPETESWVMLCGGAAFLGHCFPIYLRFQGGKGVATALGIHLYLAPLPTLAGVALFAVTVRLSGYVSLGSLTAAAALPLMIWLGGGDPKLTGLSALIGAVIWLKHHENIVRLLRGEEKSWKKVDAEKDR